MASFSALTAIFKHQHQSKLILNYRVQHIALNRFDLGGSYRGGHSHRRCVQSCNYSQDFDRPKMASTT